MDAPLSGSSVAEALGNAFRLSSDRQRHGQEAFVASPFSRLMITHVLSMAGDALVTLALAGSLFFSTPLHAARGRVALTLLLTVAPFAVVAPLLGPIIDKTRGGRRTMVVATALGRAVACFLMARYINSLLLFPAAFVTLVCSKGYLVAKATLVPSAVEHPEDLVEANSKLAVSGAIAGFLAAIPGVAILKLAGAAWVLRVDILVFLACAVTAFRLQVTEERVVVRGVDRDADVVVEEGEFPSPAARREIQARPLPPGAIQVAAFAMGTLRAVVGFLTFLVAFGFRHGHAPAWWYGVVLVCSLGGNLMGSAAGPWLRARLREEMILVGSTLTVAAVGVLALFFNAMNARPAASLLAGVVGIGAGVAKLAFDALVQRHVPAALQGRAFGRFEAGFQLVWVFGGLIPVVIPLTLRAGFFITALAAAGASVVFLVGMRLARLKQLPPWFPTVDPGTRSNRRRRPRPGPGPTGVTVPMDGPRPFPDATTVPMGNTPSWAAPPADPYRVEEMPWLDPASDLGTYPPPISGPPPLGPRARPTPPPLSGPPPRVSPLAPDQTPGSPPPVPTSPGGRPSGRTAGREPEPPTLPDIAGRPAEPPTSPYAPQSRARPPRGTRPPDEPE